MENRESVSRVCAVDRVLAKCFGGGAGYTVEEDVVWGSFADHMTFDMVVRDGRRMLVGVVVFAENASVKQLMETSVDMLRRFNAFRGDGVQVRTIIADLATGKLYDARVQLEEKDMF